MPLNARFDEDGDIEITDDQQGMMILFTVEQIRAAFGGSVDLSSVGGWGEHSPADRLAFVQDAWRFAREFANKRGLV